MGVQMNASTEVYPTLGVWEHLFGDLQGYLVTYTGRREGGELMDKKQIPWFYPEAAEKAADYLIRQSESGREAYFGVHLFKTDANRKAENAADQVGALWADGDGAQVPEGWPEPTTVIESSPGRHHFYWRLDYPIDSARAAGLNKRIAYGMNADKGKWALGTVLRAPGTRNYKRPEPTEVVIFGE
jgi:hypothetical protein